MEGWKHGENVFWRLEKLWLREVQNIKQIITYDTWKIENLPSDLVNLTKEIFKQNFNSVNLLLSIVYIKIEKEGDQLTL